MLHCKLLAWQNVHVKIMQVTVMGFIIMYKGHVKYNHFLIFQSQTLYWMIIEIKDALNYNIKRVCYGFI